MLHRALHLVLLAALLAALAGCLERRMTITSQPPGATVTVNSVEVGRTPVSASFVYFGKYQVELEREGYEPVRAKANAPTPFYEYPPIDLLASAIPLNITSDVNLHYVLTPTLARTPEAEQALLDRANTLRQQIK